MIKEMKDFMLKSNEVRLNKEKARANRELAAIESFLKQLSVSIWDEINEESKRNLKQLLKKMQKQKIFNEVFRKTCEKALLKTKNIYSGIEQEIKNIKADNNSKAVTELINISEEVRKIKQNISNTFAEGGSFASVEIIQGLNLSISSFRTK
jgi:hypothetical protein